MAKKAVMVWGGWAGHEPKQCVDVFVPILEQEGFEVTISDTLDTYKDQDLMLALLRLLALGLHEIALHLGVPRHLLHEERAQGVQVVLNIRHALGEVVARVVHAGPEIVEVVLRHGACEDELVLEVVDVGSHLLMTLPSLVIEMFELLHLAAEVIEGAVLHHDHGVQPLDGVAQRRELLTVGFELLVDAGSREIKVSLDAPVD